MSKRLGPGPPCRKAQIVVVGFGREAGYPGAIPQASSCRTLLCFVEFHSLDMPGLTVITPGLLTQARCWRGRQTSPPPGWPYSRPFARKFRRVMPYRSASCQCLKICVHGDHLAVPTPLSSRTAPNPPIHNRRPRAGGRESSNVERQRLVA